MLNPCAGPLHSSKLYSEEQILGQREVLILQLWWQILPVTPISSALEAPASFQITEDEEREWKEGPDPTPFYLDRIRCRCRFRTSPQRTAVTFSEKGTLWAPRTGFFGTGNWWDRDRLYHKKHFVVHDLSLRALCYCIVVCCFVNVFIFIKHISPDLFRMHIPEGFILMKSQ